MFKDKKSVYVIAFSLVALLSMQGMWLYYAIKQEQKFLNAGTRQAAIETVSALEQKEDSKLLITSLDTLIDVKPGKPVKSNFQKSEVQVIVLNGKKHTVVKNTNNNHVTTSYSFSENGTAQAQIKVISSTKEISKNYETNKKTKSKLKNYEQLLKKIVYQSQPKNLKIEERINFPELTTELKKNLESRGIDIVPEIAIKSKSDSIIFKTPGYYLATGIQIPMFTKDIVFQNNALHLFYPSSINYIFKRSIGVIVLSFVITLLLVTVILLLYKKMLTEQKLNQYKNDFINNLTHELKTPLATISLANSNISSAISAGDPVSVYQYTRIIDEENKKLNNHIEKVFELSLLEKEKQIFNLTNENAHTLITACIQQNQQMINEKQASITLSLKATEHIVELDKFHFMNVISNLLNNALKYNSGKATVEIATKNTEDKILLSVKDNGIGISKEHQKFIFDKFFRVTNKDLHDTKGFGIGLSYVKQTIGLFNGNIEVKSEENNGSEFIILMPYVKS